MKESAKALYDLFVEHSKDFGEPEGRLVSGEGLELMSDFFETVDRDQRGFVFLAFLQLLHENGYVYEVEQFVDIDHTDEIPELEFVPYEGTA